MIPLLLLLLSDPGQFQAQMKNGVSALERADLPAARQCFQAATVLKDSDPGAWLMLAQTMARLKDFDAARQAAAKAEVRGFDDPRILQALANFYGGALADLSSAAKLGEQYAAKAADDPAAWRKVAALYLDLGRPDDAVRTARRGLQVDDSAEIHTLLGRALVEKREYANADAEFVSSIRLDPYDEDTRFRQAQAYLLQQKFPQAAAVLESAKTIFARSPQIELALGVAYYGQRKFDQAVAQFLHTIQLAPDVVQPYVFLGRILEHADDKLPEITERFAAFRRRHPESALALMLNAKALIAQLPPSGFPSQAEEAMALTQQSLAIEDKSAESHYLLGLLLDRKKDSSSAAVQFERSIELNPKEPLAHFQLARVYQRLGRREEAERERNLHEKLSEMEKAAPLPGLDK